MSGFYHQDERDEAADKGCVVLVLALVATIVLSIVLYVLVEGYAADPMDGSRAGANAVTMEDIES